MGIGCSHGYLIDPLARKAVLKFAQDYKPEFKFHLGDWIDTTAFRSGAKGTKDETSDVDYDLLEGNNFIKEYKPQILLGGNHEGRVWSLCDHHNAILKSLACRVRQEILDMAQDIGAKFIPYKGVWSMVPFGNFKLTHGYMYGENACRDMAEVHGNIMFAHIHRAGMMNGRRDDNPMGICVGTLSDIPNMDYANTRKSTLAWSQGFVWGEYSDDLVQPFLYNKLQGAEWILP